MGVFVLAARKYDLLSFSVDIAHESILSPAQKHEVRREVDDFAQSIPGSFREVYLHLDVCLQKGKLRGKPHFLWKALMLSNKGRHYAEGHDYGVRNSLRDALNSLNFQLIRMASYDLKTHKSYKSPWKVTPTA